MAICKFCKKTFNQVAQHQTFCHDNPDRKHKTFTFTPRNCRYCGAHFVKAGQHEAYCAGNPLRYSPSNATIKAAKAGKNYEVSDKTREKLSRSSSGDKSHWKTRDPSEVALSRRKLRTSMRKAVANNPSEYAGRWRKYTCEYKGVLLDSGWERSFMVASENAGLAVVRNLKGFQYSYRGDRMYFPDFYVKRFKVFVEIKGRVTRKDLHKWRDFPDRLLVITRISALTDLRKLLRRAKASEQYVLV